MLSKVLLSQKKQSIEGSRAVWLSEFIMQSIRPFLFFGINCSIEDFRSNGFLKPYLKFVSKVQQSLRLILNLLKTNLMFLNLSTDFESRHSMRVYNLYGLHLHGIQWQYVNVILYKAIFKVCIESVLVYALHRLEKCPRPCSISGVCAKIIIIIIINVFVVLENKSLLRAHGFLNWYCSP